MPGDRAFWIPPTGVALLRHHSVCRTVTLPDGRRAKVTVDDSGTVEHTRVGRPARRHRPAEDGPDSDPFEGSVTMSRADDIRALAEAEAAVAELEDELVAAKDTDDGPTRELKLKLRDARQKYRELRPGRSAGDAVVSPDVIAATTEVPES